MRLIAVLVCVILPLFVLAQRPKEVLHTPDSSVRLAAADISSLPAKFQPYVRYLSLYNIPSEKRREVAMTVSFVINSLSKRKKIYIPVFIGGSDETLIRINLKDYDIDPKIWDQLGAKGSGPKPFPEPYFHAFVEKLDITEKKVRREKKVPTGTYVRTANGWEPEYKIDYQDEVIKTADERVKHRVLLTAPWVDTNSYAILVKATGSEFPIFRADWFNVYATLEPLYHLFLNLGEDEKSFDKAVFADQELAKKARSQTKGVVIKSAVARNNRTLLRSPSFAGYRWESHDTLKSIDDRNYVQNFLDEKFDAKEIIASLPNGLQVYFVTDAAGKRVDKADNEVATDYMAADKIVRNGRSCIYCHSSGILAIQDEIRTLNKKLLNREQVSLLVVKEEDVYRIEDLFGSNLDLQIARDQQFYADAIAMTTGTTPQKTASAFYYQWEGYVENLMTKEQMARDCGVTLAELDKFARLTNDPLFLGLIKEPIRPVRRDQFEQAFQTFMLIVMRGRAGEKGQTPAVIFDDKR